MNRTYDTSAGLKAAMKEPAPLFENLSCCHEINGYAVYPAMGQMTPALKEAIIDLWQTNRILPQTIDPLQRVEEVAMVLAQGNKVVGVSTVTLGRLSDIKIQDIDNGLFYFYRMFIQKQDRQPMLMAEMARQTREWLEQNKNSCGIVHIIENRKIERPGMRRIFERRGYETNHRTPDGTVVYIKRFTGYAQ